jgi:hypothetical protein
LWVIDWRRLGLCAVLRLAFFDFEAADFFFFVILAPEIGRPSRGQATAARTHSSGPPPEPCGPGDLDGGNPGISTGIGAGLGAAGFLGLDFWAVFFGAAFIGTAFFFFLATTSFLLAFAFFVFVFAFFTFVFFAFFAIAEAPNRLC